MPIVSERQRPLSLQLQLQWQLHMHWQLHTQGHSFRIIEIFVYYIFEILFSQVNSMKMAEKKWVEV
jgi:hypothetical protein